MELIELIGTIVAILIFVGIIIFFAQNFFTEAEASVDIGKWRTESKECRRWYDVAKRNGINLNRIEDDDFYPDACDKCPGFDDSQDRDTDGIPDGCDKNPDQVSIRECSTGLDKARQRCNPI